MRLPIRNKVLILTLGLSLAMIAVSLLISYTLFSKQIRQEARDSCIGSAENMSDEIQEYYNDFLIKYIGKIDAVYSENRETIEEVSFDQNIEYSEKRRFFKDLTSDVFPPENALGLSYDMVVFSNNYHTILNDLDMLVSNQEMADSHVFYYDAEHDNLVYLMDSVSENSSTYDFPGSVMKADNDLKRYALESDDPQAYFDSSYCIGVYPISVSYEGKEATAYVQFRKSVESTVQSQKRFFLTNAIIMLAAVGLLALIYFSLVDRFISRPIKAVSSAAASFTDKLNKSDELTISSAGLKTGDELGVLSDELDIMQQKILEYVDSLAEKTAKEESMKTELDIASRIQLQSLPESGFSAPGVHLDSFIKPAREVGGDLYDYFMIDPDHLFFVIADVSGKGVPAALFMMRGKELIKANAGVCESVSELARAVNTELCKNNEECLFITAFFGVYELSNRKLHYTRAGHEQPFLLRGGKAEKISEESNVVLGLFDFYDFEEDEIILHPGDRLLMYTDGLDEGINADHEEFGYERIHKVFETNDDVLYSLYNSLISFAGDEEQFDDITMLLLSVEPNERFIFRDPDYSVITVFCDTLDDRLSHFDTEKGSELKMVTDEILNNCISYGFEGIKDPVIIVDLTISKHQVQMTFSDNGVPFNPLTVKPDPGRSFFDRDKGGFGISFIKQFSDSQRYERIDGWNRLYILKKMEKTNDTETKE